MERERSLRSRPSTALRAVPLPRESRGRIWKSDHPKRQHRVGHLLEAGDVRAFHIVDIVAALAIFAAAFVDAEHDVLEELLELLLLPRDARAVLAHLEARDGDAAGIGGLAGGVEQFRFLEGVDAFEVG